MRGAAARTTSLLRTFCARGPRSNPRKGERGHRLSPIKRSSAPWRLVGPVLVARRERDGTVIPAGSLRQLLEAQTQELTNQTASDIDKAVKKLEATALKHIQDIRQEVATMSHQVSQQDGKIDDVKRAQAELAARISDLESFGGHQVPGVGVSFRC